jgi:hypothetical protein
MAARGEGKSKALRRPTHAPAEDRAMQAARAGSVYVNAAFAGRAPFVGSKAAYGRSAFQEKGHLMPDRRQNTRSKVIYGGVAGIGETGATRDCVVRDISDNGASLEFSHVAPPPREQISLTIARKGRSFLAKVIWWRDNFIGVAFGPETHPELPVSDLEERLRKSEAKKRQLQRRIDELLGNG